MQVGRRNGSSAYIRWRIFTPSSVNTGVHQSGRALQPLVPLQNDPLRFDIRFDSRITSKLVRGRRRNAAVYSASWWQTGDSVYLQIHRSFRRMHYSFPLASDIFCCSCVPMIRHLSKISSWPSTKRRKH